jgi:hypothetical protein
MSSSNTHIVNCHLPQWNDQKGCLLFKRPGIQVILNGEVITPGHDLVPETDSGFGIETGSPNGQILLRLCPEIFEISHKMNWGRDY